MAPREGHVKGTQDHELLKPVGVFPVWPLACYIPRHEYMSGFNLKVKP